MFLSGVIFPRVAPWQPSGLSGGRRRRGRLREWVVVVVLVVVMVVVRIAVGGDGGWVGLVCILE